MVANRLTGPRPLKHIDQWAERWGVGEVLDTPFLRETLHG